MKFLNQIKSKFCTAIHITQKEDKKKEKENLEAEEYFVIETSEAKICNLTCKRLK